jgi:hypothetical protein
MDPAFSKASPPDFLPSHNAVPIDACVDNVQLRELLVLDAERRREGLLARSRHITPKQRAAISAHWSAELRAKVAASRAAAAELQLRVVVDRRGVTTSWPSTPAASTFF